MSALERDLWPADRLLDALEMFRDASCTTPLAGLTPPLDPEPLGDWLARAAPFLGLEIEEVAPQHAEVERLLAVGAPAIVSIRRAGRTSFLVVSEAKGRSVSLLRPDRKKHRVERSALCRAMKEENEAPLRPSIEALIRAAKIPKHRRPSAVDAILDVRISERTRPVWLLRRRRARTIRSVRALAGPIAAMILTRAASSFTLIALFWVIGAGFFAGELGIARLLACGLLVATRVPLHLLELWLGGMFSVRAGALLKRRLLAGALALRPDEIKSEGAGLHFSRAYEADSVEAVAVGGGLLGMLSIVDLLLAAAVLPSGAGGSITLLALFAWVLLFAAFAARHFRRVRRWSRARIEISSALLERMLGHRTRLAQGSPERQHEEEERELLAYSETSREMDRSSVLCGIIPVGWSLVALLTMIGPIIAGIEAPALAIAMGGILLAARALEGMVASMHQLAGAASSFGEVRPLWRAATRSVPLGHPRISLGRTGQTEGALVELCNVDVDAGVQPVLRSVNLALRRGDRLLLEGASGSGKSTLARILSGLDRPKRGLVVLRGLDLNTTGRERWRSAIASAPQLQENHVFSATLAFNLLLGRRWPPSPSDLEEARAVCGSLGLGGMLERMPAGLEQMIGDAGWRLSHGERSRVFIARTLLSDADLIVLDESLAALDPETLREVMRCLIDRTTTLLLIAHP